MFGVPDERLGEQVAAWIQSHAGVTASEDEICDRCRDATAHFKIPRFIRCVEQFPLTFTGNPRRYKMREAMSDLMRAE